jgi:ATP synthase protein I
MSDSKPPNSLARFSERLAQARRREGQEPERGDGTPPPRGFGLGMRIGIELVAALCVGLALGWVIDRILGTRPWGLIVFFFLGAAAGMLNVFRMAKGLGQTPKRG